MSSAKFPVEINVDLLKCGFLDTFDYVLCDCDGVLWNGNTAIPHSLEAIEILRKKGKKVLLVTNNDVKSRKGYAEKCRKLGLNIKDREIFSSAFAVAFYLRSQNFKESIYAIGSEAIKTELTAVGISCLPVGPEPMDSDWIELVAKLKLDPKVGAVVVGFDEHISYPKLMKACSYLRNPSCLFLATNLDEAFPSEQNIAIPGGGPIVEAIKYVTKRHPFNCGKPESTIFNAVMCEYPDINPNKCIMIGDRLDTDVLLGKNNGLKTVLVLTGCNTLKDVQRCKESNNRQDQLQVPDYYVESLGELGNLIASC